MGITKKLSSSTKDGPSQGTAEASEEVTQLVEEIVTSIKEGKGGLKAIAIPEGMKGSDVVKMLRDKLKERLGVEVPSVTLGEEVEVESHNILEPGGFDRLLEGFHEHTRKLEILGMDLTDIPLPEDPTKRAFCDSLNKLHRQIHELVPTIYGIASSLKALEAMSECDPALPPHKQTQAMGNFRSAVGQLMAMLAEMGAATCVFHQQVHERGVPVNDGPVSVN